MLPRRERSTRYRAGIRKPSRLEPNDRAARMAGIGAQLPVLLALRSDECCPDPVIGRR
jgi:hypothetical protein